MIFEHWNINGGRSYIYTENVDVAKFLRKELGGCAPYYDSRERRTVGWQFVCPNERIPELKCRANTLAQSSNTEGSEKVQKLPLKFQ
jgi:hypothetical protein